MTCNVQLKRRGFTIVELLVVLVIISILAALSLGVIGGMLTSARTAATSATLTKINDRIKNRAQSLSEVDMAQYEIAASNEPIDLDSLKPVQRKIIAKKLLYREAFPQNWQEVWDNPSLQEDYKKYFVEGQVAVGNPGAPSPNNKPPLPSTPATIAAESSEVLYYLLTRAPIPGQGRRKVISGVGQTTADEFGEGDVKDTDGDGLMEFVDGWENPLRFYRWPTRLIRSQGTNSSTGALNNFAINPPDAWDDLANAKILIPAITTLDFAKTDPDDSYGAMESAGTFTAHDFENNYHTPGTYHVPLVVSVGEDGILGLYEPTDVARFGHLASYRVTPPPPTTDPDYEVHFAAYIEHMYDNLSNHNNRPGGN